MLSFLNVPWRRILELDLRSLAVARIGLGFFLFLDTCFRALNFKAHYTEFGVLPLSILEKLYRPQGPCLHCWYSADSWVAALFFIQAIFALTLMLGFKTRLSLLVSWLLTISLQYRNPLIIDGGDVLLRCFLVWMFFLPVAKHFSLDAKKNKSAATSSVHWFNFSIPLQLFMLYFMSALLKTGQDWWPLGTATGYALSLEAFVTPFGRWLTQFPESLKILTRLVFVTELWAPVLLLMWGRFRMAGAFIFIAFHAGLALAMDLALFPWIAFSCLAALLPKEFWDFIETHFQKKAQSTYLEIKNTKIQHAFCALIVPVFLTAMAWNYATYTKKALPKSVARIGRWFHVDQYWGMFAPYPLKDSGWYEFGVELWNGQYVYAFVNDKMEDNWDEKIHRPKSGNKYFVDQRWRKYLVNLWDKKNAKFRPALAAYLCRKWNSDFPAPSDKALHVDMEFTLFQNKEYLKPAREPANINLGTYKCGDN